MFKIFKDQRRRAVETIYETVGAAEITSDQEFEVFEKKFETVIAELNLCTTSLSQTISSQKVSFSDSKDLSNVLQRIYQSNQVDAAWPEDSKQLKYGDAAEAYKKSWDNINDVIRSSAVSICVDDTLEPIKDSALKLSKTIEEEVKSRRIRLKDFDSYRRRLKGHQQKRDTAEAQGKANTPAHADTLAEIQRFEAKVQTAGENYRAENLKTKEDILSSKERHDELIDSYLLTVVVAQAELFSRAYEQLNEVLKLLPQDQVQAVRARIQETIMTGGAQQKAQPKESSGYFSRSPRLPTVPEGSSTKNTGASNNGGIAQNSARNNNNQSTAAVPPAVAQPTVSTPITPPAAAANHKEYAIALFDNEVDDDEELAFKIGERIEVLEKDDSGWYKGRLDGREGLFPVNYVKME